MPKREFSVQNFHSLMIGILLVFFLALAGLDGYKQDQINKLKKDVACLKHPHGESSVFATRGKDGKFHASKPHYTGC